MIDLLTETLKAWMKHRAASRGAALAFYTLFAIAPILLLAVAVAGYFFGARAAQGDTNWIEDEMTAITHLARNSR